VSQEHEGRRAAKRQTNDDHYSAHGNDGATVELPAWAADDEAPV